MSVNTVQTEGLGSFFKSSGTISAKAGKKIATKELKSSERALEITSFIATAAATKIHKAAVSTLPEVIIFSHKKQGIYLGNFIQFILYK